MAKRPRKSVAAAPKSATAAAPASDTGGSTSAAEEAAGADAPGGDLTRVLVASVRPQGRRRAGRAFGPEPVELHVSDDTLALLEGDDQLVVKRG